MSQKPPFRADHVGSFLRPQRLLEARDAARPRRDRRRGAARGRGRGDRATSCASRRSVGLQGITDGEFRRTYFHIDFLEQLDGVEVARAASPRRSGATTAPRSASRRRSCA